MRNLLAMAFRQQGQETVLAASVEEAQGFVQSGDCAALLMDYHLGAGADGSRVVEDWSRQGPLPPFWLVTGTPEQVPVPTLEALSGFQGVVGKPFSILDLVQKVCSQVAAAVREREAE